jgi:hypothetical protein
MQRIAKPQATANHDSDRRAAQRSQDTLVSRMGVPRHGHAARLPLAIGGTVLLCVSLPACVTVNANGWNWLSLAGLVAIAASALLPSGWELAERERNARVGVLYQTPLDSRSREAIERTVRRREALGLLPAEAPELDTVLQLHCRNGVRISEHPVDTALAHAPSEAER